MDVWAQQRGSRRMNREVGLAVRALPCIKQTASGNPPQSTGRSPSALWWPRGVGCAGRQALEGGDTYTHISDLLHQTAETDTTLWSNYSESESGSSHSTLCNPMDHTAQILQNTGVVAVPFSRGLPNPGIEPRFPALQADSLPAESPGSPKKQLYSNLKKKTKIK